MRSGPEQLFKVAFAVSPVSFGILLEVFEEFIEARVARNATHIDSSVDDKDEGILGKHEIFGQDISDKLADARFGGGSWLVKYACDKRRKCKKTVRTQHNFCKHNVFRTSGSGVVVWQ